METVIRRIDKVNDFFGKIVAWLVVPLTLLIVLEVIKRRFFNAPSIWNFELSSFIFGAHFMLAAAYGLLHKAHVSVDIVTTKFLSPRKAAILDLVVYLILFFPFVIVLVCFGTGFAATSWIQLETSWSIWHPPVYPIKTVIPLTGLLLGFQGLSEIMKIIFFLRRGERWTH